MLIGYARVSTTDQSLDIQIEQLTTVGCDRIFSEKKSGKTMDGRAELDACIKFAREGDTIMVCRLDRFARSMGDFCNLIREMQKKKIGFRCLEPNLDTTGAVGELTMHILMAVAQFELTLRADRQREGIQAAKDRGAYKRVLSARTAKRKTLIYEAHKKYPDASAQTIGRLLKISDRTVYRLTPELWTGNLPPGLVRYLAEQQRKKVEGLESKDRPPER